MQGNVSHDWKEETPEAKARWFQSLPLSERMELLCAFTDFSEVLFIDMEPEDGELEPLIGYIVLEQSQAAVDMLGHRLIHVKRLDLK